MKYIPFKDAREIIRTLKINSVKQYFDLFKNKQIPSNIPLNPNRDYEEFTSWPDFLGNNNTAANNKKFYTYTECQKYLLDKGINSKEKFERWRLNKENDLVPSRPDKTYRAEWKSWGEFLKTGRIADIEKHKLLLAYQEAKEFLKQFCFKNETEFYNWAKTNSRPTNIPASPRNAYGEDFISMGDFLSNGNYHFKEYFSYDECKEFVQSLNLNSIREFYSWINKNKASVKVPAHPCDIYPEFEGWPEFLGYQRRVSVGEKKISSILASNNIQHKLQYTIPDCKDVSVLPFDIAIIKDDSLLCLIEYHGVQHFFPIEFFGGEEALDQTKKRDKIKRDFCNENKIPLLEINYQDNLEKKLELFLDSFNLTLDFSLPRAKALNKNFLSYEEAKQLLKSTDIKSSKEFLSAKGKIPYGIPHSPHIFYVGKGWVSWGDFLGTNKTQTKKAKFVSFEQAKEWFKESNIKSGDHWKKIRHTKPSTIPCHPDKIYKDKWSGWKDFLN